MRKTVTIEEVAQRAGIGLGTASRALSGRGSVSPKTRQHVLDIAFKMGYEANPHAQRLANGHVKNTVAIFAGIDLGIATLRLWQITDRLDEQDYITDVHLVPTHVANQEQRQIMILRDLRRLNPIAIVSQSMGLDEGALHELRQYQANGGTVVTFDEPVDLECDQIIFDQEDSSYQATKYLLDKGHRAIGYCHHALLSPDSVRIRGVERALREAGVASLHTSLSYKRLKDIGRKMAEQYFALKKRPTAVISNDNAAAAFMHAVMSCGVRVPEELSIIGYDDTPPAQTAIVPITSIAYPFQQIGDHVADMVQTRLNGTEQGPPRHIHLKGTLVERESVAAPRA